MSFFEATLDIAYAGSRQFAYCSATYDYHYHMGKGRRDPRSVYN